MFESVQCLSRFSVCVGSVFASVQCFVGSVFASVQCLRRFSVCVGSVFASVQCLRRFSVLRRFRV